MTTRSILFVIGLLLCLTACEEAVRTGDGGIDPNDPSAGKSCLGGVDKSIDFDTAAPLELGKTLEGYICPRGDRDFYKLAVPAGTDLTRIKLQHTNKATRVDLRYLVYAGKNNKQPVDPPKAPQEKNNFNAVHCTGSGEYYLVVQDSGNTHYDGKNAYALTVSADADPDSNEPNDTPEQATKVTGNVQGYISCSGDKDYFEVEVSAGQLLEVKLKPEKPTLVDMQYVIYDSANNKVGEAAIPDATRPDAKLEVVHHLPGAGKYYIEVSDSNGTESDSTTSYSLSYGTKPEPDPNEGNDRNDTPATATVLGSGAGVNKTIKGQLASKADLDVFVVKGLDNISESNPAVMEVRLKFAGGQVPLDPSFRMLYPHKGTSCTKDACCGVLNSDSGGCNDVLDCIRETYSCISKGDNFCNDAECSPNATQSCAVERACAGASLCLPEKLCAAEHTFRYAKDRTQESMVLTSQLLTHAGPWYVVVSDHGSDEYEPGRTYELQVRVQMDPDLKEGRTEPDNELWPDQCLLAKYPNIEDWDMHCDQAKKRIRKINWDQWYTGYLSYEGDLDFFELPNPGSGDYTLTLDFQTGGNCPTTGPRRWCEDASKNKDKVGLEFFYTLRKGTKGWASVNRVLKPGESGSYGQYGSGGDRKCMYAARYSGKYWLTVEDWNKNNWSWSCYYRFRLRKSSGCNSPCTIKYDKCSLP
jgi:hypothetical protein